VTVRRLPRAPQRRSGKALLFTGSSWTTRAKGELPPSGPLPSVLQTVAARWSAYRYFEAAYALLGKRFTIYPLDMPPLVFLSDPDDIRAILTADARILHPGAGSAILTPLIGPRSFMLLEEDEHHLSRRAISPAFHRHMVAEHTTMLADMTEQGTANWPTGVEVGMSAHLRSLTLHIILEAIFGEAAELGPLHSALIETFNVSASVLLQEPKLRHCPGWRRSWKEFGQAQARADNLLSRLVNEHRATQSRGLIDLLSNATRSDGSPMTENEVRDNLLSMILAGHETTTGELAWAFLLLAQHQEVQERLSEEVQRGEDSYLTATVNETMRRRPVFLFAIPRAVVDQVEIGGVTYRAPAHLAACTYLLHNDPALFTRPREFRPERFLEEPPDPRTWLPWGGGKKHCLGRHFALTEVKEILRATVSKYRILPARAQLEAPRWRTSILVPGNGARVVLAPRR
jgi:cytochrome P450